MYPHHRTWFPFILAGLTLALALVILANVNDGLISNDALIKRVAPTNEEYQIALSSICAEFASQDDARAIYESLLKMVVPTDFKDAHLALVLLFGNATGDVSLDVSAELATLQERFPWLTISCDITQ